MAGKSLKTIFDVLARDGATPVLNKVTNSFGSMRKAAKSADQALGGMNAGAAAMQKRMTTIMAGGIIGAGFLKAGAGLQNFVKGAVAQAGDLEYELATLKGISGATADEMDRLAAAASKAGVETQFTPTQAVEGLAALAQQGFTTAQQLDTLMPSLFLAGASGGKIPLEEGAKLTTQTLKAFGLQAEDAGILVDQLVKTTTQSGLAIDELTESLQNASAGAISMGLGIEDSMAALGLIKNIIPSAAMAGSAFQIMTGRLSATRTQKKIKEAMGIDVVDAATGKYMAFDKLLVKMSDKLGKMEEGARGALVGEAFGERAKKGILSIFQQLSTGITTTEGQVLKGAEAFAYYKDQLDPDVVRGFAQSMNDLKLDTLRGQMELLTGSVQTFMMEMGKGSAAFSKKIVKAFLGGFNTMLSMFQELPDGLKTGIAAFVMLAGTITKLIGVILIARAGLGLFGFSLSGVLMGIGKMLLLAAPLTLFFGGIALGAYGIYRAVARNFGNAEKSTASFTDKVKMAFKGIVDIVKTGGLSEATEKEFLKMGKSPMLSAFFKRFISMWRNAKAFFSGVVQGFDEGLVRLEGPWNRFTDVITRVFNIWTGGTQRGISDTGIWTEKGRIFGDTLVGLSEMVLDLMTKFVELGEKGAQSLEGITVDDVVDGFAKLIGVIKVVGRAFHGVFWLFDKIGTHIGEMVGGIVTLFDGLGSVISGFWNNNEQLSAAGMAKIKGVLTGEFTSAGASLRENMARQREQAGGLAETRELALARMRFAVGARERDTTPLDGLDRGERRAAMSGDQTVMSQMNSNIAEMTARLRARQAEIVEYKKSEDYQEGVVAPQTRQALAEEMKVIKQALTQTPKVIMVNVDGRRLFEVQMENAAEDREDNFDDPNMSPVTQPGAI